MLFLILIVLIAGAMILFTFNSIVKSKLSKKVMKPLYYYNNSAKTGRRQTIAGIVNEAEHTLSIGIAECSKKDQFVKSKGRLIAAGRAVSSHNKKIVLPLQTSSTPTQQFVEFAKTL